MKFFSKRVLIKSFVLFVIYSLIGMLIERSVPGAILFGLLIASIDELVDIITYVGDCEDYIEFLKKEEGNDNEKYN